MIKKINIEIGLDTDVEVDFYLKEKVMRLLKSDDLCAVLHDFLNYLRADLKYGNLSSSHYKRTEDVRDKLFELMEDHGINLDEIYT